MRLRTRIRDCLYLNWAVPATRLPPAPPSLRFETHAIAGRDHALVSALLFRQESLQPTSLPLLRLSFPQFNLRLYVTDGDGVPSVLFRRMLVPAWVVPSVRLVAHQPVESARFSYHTTTGDDEGSTAWEWRVSCGSRFACRAEPGASGLSGEPFGSWEEAVDYVRLRNRGYFHSHGRLIRIDTENHPVEAVPVRAVVDDISLIEDSMGWQRWPPLQSAWLCPEMPLVFDLVRDTALALPTRAAVPG